MSGDDCVEEGVLGQGAYATVFQVKIKKQGQVGSLRSLFWFQFQFSPITFPSSCVNNSCTNTQHARTTFILIQCRAMLIIILATK